MVYLHFFQNHKDIGQWWITWCNRQCYNSNKSFLTSAAALKLKRDNLNKFETSEECEKEINKLTKDIAEMKWQYHQEIIQFWFKM